MTGTITGHSETMATNCLVQKSMELQATEGFISTTQQLHSAFLICEMGVILLFPRAVVDDKPRIAGGAQAPCQAQSRHSGELRVSLCPQQDQGWVLGSKSR
jgi:hypothetical protein